MIVSGATPPAGFIVTIAARAASMQKLVYTSIIGPDVGTPLSPVVQSSRYTEKDIKASGLDWAIGRNGS